MSINPWFRNTKSSALWPCMRSESANESQLVVQLTGSKLQLRTSISSMLAYDLQSGTKVRMNYPGQAILGTIMQLGWHLLSELSQRMWVEWAPGQRCPYGGGLTEKVVGVGPCAFMSLFG